VELTPLSAACGPRSALAEAVEVPIRLTLHGTLSLLLTGSGTRADA